MQKSIILKINRSRLTYLLARRTFGGWTSWRMWAMHSTHYLTQVRLRGALYLAWVCGRLRRLSTTLINTTELLTVDTWVRTDMIVLGQVKLQFFPYNFRNISRHLGQFFSPKNLPKSKTIYDFKKSFPICKSGSIGQPGQAERIGHKIRKFAD